MRWIVIGLVVLCAGCASNGRNRLSADDGEQLGRMIACALAPQGCSGQQNAAPQHQPTGGSSAYFVYGGLNHEVFLGCLSCDAYALNSIRNVDGPHGATYAAASVSNHNSPYGDSYSDTSACNSIASNPPVIVDARGHYYGRLTLNPYRDQIQAAIIIRWLSGVCGN